MVLAGIGLLVGCAVQGPQIESSAEARGSLFVAEANNLPGEIFIDHLPSGLTTPLLVENLPLGRHTIHLRYPGYRSEPESLSVNLQEGEAGSFAEAHFKLVRLPASTTASLSVQSTPANATVTLNGVVLGTSPLVIEALTPGTYTLGCGRGNHRGSDTSITLAAGQAASVSRTLRFTPYAVLEQFSHTNCTPGCPLADAAIEEILPTIDSVEVHRISYHTSTLGPDDPLYAFAPTEMDGRSAFYEVDFVPRVFLNGGPIDYTSIAGLKTTLAATIDRERITQPDALYFRDIRYSAATIDGEVVIDSTADRGARLRIALIQATVEFSQPPGINGQKLFHDICRGLSPDETGVALSAAGQTVHHFSFPIEELARHDLKIVAFLQDETSRTILQAVAFDLPIE